MRTTLQKKLVEMERCKDISLKIEQRDTSFSQGKKICSLN